MEILRAHKILCVTVGRVLRVQESRHRSTIEIRTAMPRRMKERVCSRKHMKNDHMHTISAFVRITNVPRKKEKQATSDHLKLNVITVSMMILVR